MRLFRLALLLAVVLCIPFLFWGDRFELLFSGEIAAEWLLGCGRLGWMVVMGLLVADIVMPIPSTGLMSVAGFLYGPIIGGVVSAAGSFLSGMVAYTLSGIFGRAAAARLTNARDLAENATLFDKHGPWLIALSRALPLLPEVSCCLAGLAGMRFSTFALSLACGCVPVGFAFAAIGAAGQEHPGLAIGLSVAVPAVLWVIVRAMLKTHHGRPRP